MANSIVAQHNLIRNALPLPQVTSRLINHVPTAPFFLLALGASVLSYTSLLEIARTNGLLPRLAWIGPLLVHFILIVISLTVVRVRLHSERTMWSWLLASFYSIATTTFNIIHTPNHLITQIIAVVAPESACFYLLKPRRVRLEGRQSGVW